MAFSRSDGAGPPTVPRIIGDRRRRIENAVEEVASSNRDIEIERLHVLGLAEVARKGAAAGLAFDIKGATL